MGLKLESEISLKSAAFEKGLDRARDSVKDLAKDFVLGAVGVGTLTAAFEKTFETADELVNTAKRLNMTVEQVQLLRQAAKDAGQEMDTVSHALEKINEARAKALGGDRSAMAAFTALGVDHKSLMSQTAASLFMGQIGNKVKTTSPEEIAAPLKEVLGKGAGEAVDILKTDFAGLDKKMKETGALMSGEVAAKLNVISKEFSMLSNVIVAKLAPAILALVQWLYKFALKSGGIIAGAAGTVGSMVGQVGWIKSGKALTELLGTNFKNLFTGKGFTASQGQIDDIMKANGINRNEARNAGEAAQAPWEQKLDEFKKALEEAAKSIENPKPADFSKTQAFESAAKEHGRGKDSDALVKVGNFLGTSQNTINRMQALLVHHAAATANNTKRTADALDKIKLGMSTYKAPTLDSGIQWSGMN